MNAGKYVLAQVMEFLPRYEFDKLVRIVRPMYAKEIIPDVDLPEKVILALDSTTISCSIRLISWAYGKYGRGAVKRHKENAFFITRAKSNMRYSIIERRDVDRATGLRDDVSVRLSGSRSGKLYPEEMRLIRYYDGDSDEKLEFITNNLELKVIDVANLYRKRWQIETFFKWMKSNLTIKTLWGHTENAVRIHLRELLNDKNNDFSDSNHDVNALNLFNGLN